MADLLNTAGGDLEIRCAPLGWDYGLTQTKIDEETFTGVIAFGPRHLPKVRLIL